VAKWLTNIMNLPNTLQQVVVEQLYGARSSIVHLRSASGANTYFVPYVLRVSGSIMLVELWVSLSIFGHNEEQCRNLEDFIGEVKQL